MKIILSIGAVILLVVCGFVLWSPTPLPAPADINSEIEADKLIQEEVPSDIVLASGTYIVDVEASTVQWAGKKPLIEGYVNSGSIAIQNGVVTVGNAEHTAELTIDMQTLSVTGTPAKPGRESALQEHLQGERWFNVAQYPTATFRISKITSRVDSDVTSIYDVVGELTLKGQTGPLTFPAKIYTNTDGTLHAEASLEFNRTQWGITSGSGSFFDNLANNVIDDMVALSFNLTAKRQ